MSTLICFDINGTLIARDGRTDLPYAQALDRLLGQENAMAGVNTAARSDHAVFMEVLEKHGCAYGDDLWQRFLTLYKEALEAWKDTDVWRPNGDAVPFVESLVATGTYHLALITGELSLGAAYKLTKIGLWQYFPAGGFGEHGLSRFDIAAHAVITAKKHYQVDHYGKCYVIGDTVLDIRTARHLGAQAIAIATGADTWDTLAAEKPDHLIQAFGGFSLDHF